MLPDLVLKAASDHDRKPSPFTLTDQQVRAIAMMSARDRRLTLGDLFHIHAYGELTRLIAPLRMGPHWQRAYLRDWEANGEAYRDYAEQVFAGALRMEAA